MMNKDTFIQLKEKAKDWPLIGDLLDPKAKIALVRLSGVIADGSSGRDARINYKTFAPLLEEAFETSDIKAVALVINSPGGSPAQSELVGKEIRRLSAQHEVPVLVFVEDVAASGGYWIACAGDEIYACATSIVGSIGVISASFGFQDLIEKYGVERRLHTSGTDKSFLDPFSPEKPSDVSKLKDIQHALHDQFIKWVESRRGEKMDDPKGNKLFEGGFWLAQQAKDYGLIDGIGHIDEILRNKFGKRLNVIEIVPDRGFFASLLGGGVSLNIADKSLETLKDRQISSRFGL